MPEQESDTHTRQQTALIDDALLPPGWARVIGRNTPKDPITTFTNDADWFDVTIYSRDTEQYQVTATRGPDHPHQGELDEPLRKQSQVPEDRVELVAVGFMLTASDMDPFTNRFTKGWTRPNREE